MSTEEKRDLTCSICYGDLSIKNLVVSSCDHTYCNTCFFRWLRTNNTCAMCRKDFINDDLERLSLSNLSIELIDLHLRGKEIMQKNINLINETRRLKKDLEEKNEELKQKKNMELKYDKKLE